MSRHVDPWKSCKNSIFQKAKAGPVFYWKLKIVLLSVYTGTEG